VLSRLTDHDLSNTAFPFLSARELDLGWAKAAALRVSYTGELGWELLVPTEFAADVYDKVVAAGADAGLRHAGAFAFDALRLERGFRSWGHDAGVLDDPYASGLGFAVHLRKDHFAGRAALAELHDAPRDRRLMSVKVEDPSTMLWHGEPVFVNDRHAGHVTSGGYGHTLGAPVGLAWVHGKVPVGADVTVQIRGQQVLATLGDDPFYDPTGDRLRS
jgi:4-methylaminobutanoate oxidase (formaldehyde-forming)